MGLNNMKQFLYILPILILTACTGQQVEPTGVDKPKLNLASPDPVSVLPVTFKVVTINNSETVLKENPAMLCMTAQNYQNLSENLISTMAFIDQQRLVIDKYKKYYESNSQ